MVISSRQTIATLDGNISLSLNSLTSQQVETTKYLGQFLTWRNYFIYQLFWTQACPEGRRTNGIQVPKCQTKGGMWRFNSQEDQACCCFGAPHKTYTGQQSSLTLLTVVLFGIELVKRQQTVFKSCKIGPLMLLQVLLVQNIQLMIFDMNLAGSHLVK